MQPITFTIDVSRIRQLGSSKRGSQMTSTEAGAFLVLYGQELEDLLGVAVKQFVEGKL